MTTTVPFTSLDEAVLHLEEELGPWNVQIEVGSAARLDAERLYDAVETTAGAHPLARARQRDYSALDGEVRLVTRYSQAQFDQDAAERFTDLYLCWLADTVA